MKSTTTKIFSVVALLLAVACDPCPEQGGAGEQVAYIDPAVCTPEGPGWTGGQPWTSDKVDAALMNCPIGAAVPDGATITGFDIRWYQGVEGTGSLGAAMLKRSFGQGEEMVGVRVLISAYGETVVDGLGGLAEVADRDTGYRVTIETSGTTQICRMYEIAVYYTWP